MICASFRSSVHVSRTAQAGFSLVEVAIALVVAGLMSWAAFSGYETVLAQQEIERGRAEDQQLPKVQVDPVGGHDPIEAKQAQGEAGDQYHRKVGGHEQQDAHHGCNILPTDKGIA